MSSDSPAKTKSHYFVQRYEDDEGNKYCEYCGKKFQSNRPKQKYCSRECYRQGIKATKALWYQKNKEDRERKNREWYRRTREYKFRPVPKYLISQIKRKRCSLIKYELIQLELLTRQLKDRFYLKERTKDLKLPPKVRKVFDQERIDYIKKRLDNLGLPHGEAYPLEFPKYGQEDIRRRKRPPQYNYIEWS